MHFTLCVSVFIKLIVWFERLCNITYSFIHVAESILLLYKLLSKSGKFIARLMYLSINQVW
jgi:hypothetical protein